MELNNDKAPTVFIKCECGTEGMMVDFDKECKHFNFSYWKYGSDPRYFPLWRRITTAFRFIFSGKMWSDEVIIHNDDIENLTNFIEKNKIK